MKWTQYLEQSGLLEREHSQADIDALHTQFRREYQKQYKQRRKQKVKQVSVCLPIAEHKCLSLEAEQAGLSVPQYLRIAALAQADNTVVQYYPEEIRQLAVQVKRIGSNINTLCKKGHAFHFLQAGEVQHLQDSLQRIELLLQGFSTTSLVEKEEAIKAGI